MASPGDMEPVGEESRRERSGRGRRIAVWSAVVLLLIAMIAAWRLTPLQSLAEPERLKELISNYLTLPWGPLVLGLAYCLANLTLFPNMIVSIAVILALGPWIGVPAALAGSLLAGYLAFVGGEIFGKARLDRVRSVKIQSGIEMVRNSGLPGMILLRMIPIAPYPVINVALGAGGVPTWTFVAGTAIGIFPSLVAMGAFGLSLDSVWREPSLSGQLLMAGIVAVYLLLIHWLRQTLRSRVESPGRKLTSDC